MYKSSMRQKPYALVGWLIHILNRFIGLAADAMGERGFNEIINITIQHIGRAL